MKYRHTYDTEIGPITLAEKDGAITDLRFGAYRFAEESVDRETDLLRDAARQLGEYLRGRRTAFDLPLNPEGTEFQKSVWRALRDIPDATLSARPRATRRREGASPRGAPRVPHNPD